jgi:hypothetical protein
MCAQYLPIVFECTEESLTGDPDRVRTAKWQIALDS